MSSMRNNPCSRRCMMCMYDALMTDMTDGPNFLRVRMGLQLWTTRHIRHKSIIIHSSMIMRRSTMTMAEINYDDRCQLHSV